MLKFDNTRQNTTPVTYDTCVTYKYNLRKTYVANQIIETETVCLSRIKIKKGNYEEVNRIL